MTLSRQNNFDLIRLLAALEVMIFHGLTHFQIFLPWVEPLKKVIHLIPGVPVFFTLSGFLIFQSVERNRHKMKLYALNRSLRIYPALWMCLLVTIVLMMVSGSLPADRFLSLSFVKWFLAHFTFFQFFNNESVAHWGVGHPNGSLWSISVELQFYVILPLLFFLFFRKERSLLAKNLIIATLMLVSILFKSFQPSVLASSPGLGHLMGVFVLNYLYFFLTGVLIYLNYGFLRPYLENKAKYWLSLYLVYMIVFHFLLKQIDSVYDTNFIGVLGEIILALATVSAAYSSTTLGEKLLKGNDLSYGLYIYHMPVINYFFHQSQYISLGKFLLIMGIIVVIAFLSWKLVEQKMLKLKTKINL